MKRFVISSLAVAIVFATSSLAYDPPKGLKWGMTYEEVKAHLATLSKDDRSEVGNLMIVEPKSSKKRALAENLLGGVPIIDNIQFTEFKKNLEIAKKKIHQSYLFFHPENGLCSVWYRRQFTDEKEKATNLAWDYFKTIQTLLITKYGEPKESIDLNTPHIQLLPESPIRVHWMSNEDGAVIVLSIRQVKQAFFSYPAVEIQYLTSDYYKLVEAQLKRLVDEEDIL